jgi:hypothetical protein
MIADGREFIYRIDPHDRIVFANENWYDFARENGAKTLDAHAVIGRSLWDFIGDPETRHLFGILLQKVRDKGGSVTFPYRCDSPDYRRFMELKILLQPGHEIEFRSRILRLEQRDRVRLMEEDMARTREFLVMCGWCKKVRMPGSRWVEVESAVQELNLFGAPRLPRVSHGICESCSAAFHRALDPDSPERDPALRFCSAQK